jgi:hypothetical protein
VQGLRLKNAQLQHRIATVERKLKDSNRLSGIEGWVHWAACRPAGGSLRAGPGGSARQWQLWGGVLLDQGYWRGSVGRNCQYSTGARQGKAGPTKIQLLGRYRLHSQLGVYGIWQQLPKCSCHKQPAIRQATMQLASPGGQLPLNSF